MKDLNACFAKLNLGLPDDVRRLKEAGFYREAIERIDVYLAEDWTETQNQPAQGTAALPQNPAPHGLEEMRDALTAQREIIRRTAEQYCLTAQQVQQRLCRAVRDFSEEEFQILDRAGALDWRFVQGEKRYLRRVVETLYATHADLAARRFDQPAKEPGWEQYEAQHDQMVRTGAASAEITLKTQIGMSDEAFEKALAAAKAQGRQAVKVRVWLPLAAACPAQSEVRLDSFTEQPTYIAPEDAPQRTAYWEAELTENRSFGAVYSYRSTAYYADPLQMIPDAVQPDLDTEEELPHLEFTPYLRALAAQLTEGITDPVQKAKRFYDHVTLNVHYHFQPSYFIQENITDNCARSRRGDCGVMAATFIVLCRIAGIPARWQSGLVARPDQAGCHDWAMFYVAPRGWMYADCSAGASMARAGNEKMRLHYFGNLDTGRMVANRALCAPFDPPMYGFRADPCDNQVGEIEADGVGLYGDEVVTSQKTVHYQEL